MTGGVVMGAAPEFRAPPAPGHLGTGRRAGQARRQSRRTRTGLRPSAPCHCFLGRGLPVQALELTPQVNATPSLQSQFATFLLTGGSTTHVRTRAFLTQHVTSGLFRGPAVPIPAEGPPCWKLPVASGVHTSVSGAEVDTGLSRQVSAAGHRCPAHTGP